MFASIQYVGCSVVKRENARSIAAVVGSMNASATRYATRICCQAGKDNVEIIDGLKDAVKVLPSTLTLTDRESSGSKQELRWAGGIQAQHAHVGVPGLRRVASHSAAGAVPQWLSGLGCKRTVVRV